MKEIYIENPLFGKIRWTVPTFVENNWGEICRIFVKPGQSAEENEAQLIKNLQVLFSSFSGLVIFTIMDSIKRQDPSRLDIVHAALKVCKETLADR